MRALKDPPPTERFICHGGRNDLINQNRQEYVLLSSKWQSLRGVIALSMETPTKARLARFIFTWAQSFGMRPPYKLGITEIEPGRAA